MLRRNTISGAPEAVKHWSREMYRVINNSLFSAHAQAHTRSSARLSTNHRMLFIKLMPRVHMRVGYNIMY